MVVLFSSLPIFIRYLLLIQLINRINNEVAMPTQTADLIIFGFLLAEFRI